MLAFSHSGFSPPNCSLSGGMFCLVSIFLVSPQSGTPRHKGTGVPLDVCSLPTHAHI